MNAQLVASRFFVYTGCLFFILEHLSLSILSYSTVFSVFHLFLTTVLILLSKFAEYTLSTKRIMVGILLLIPVHYFGLMGYTGLGSIMILLYFALPYFYLDQIRLTRNDYKWLTIIFVLFMALYFVVPKGNFNTNTVGFIWGCCGIYSTMLVKNKHIAFVLLLAGFVLLQIHLSDTRTATVAFALYVFLRYVPSYFYKKKWLFTMAVLVLIFGSLVYVYGYIYMYENHIDVSWAAEYSDKRFFSGRQFIWMEILGLLHQSPWVGIGSSVTLLSFSENLNIHNSALNIIAVYGYPLGLLCILLIVNSLYKLRGYCDNPIVRNCLAAYVYFLILSYSETNLLAESFSALLPLCIAYSEIHRKSKVNKA